MWHLNKWPMLSVACCVFWASRAGAQPEDKSRPIAVIPPVVVAPVAGVAPVMEVAPVAGVAPLGTKANDQDVATVGLSASAVKMPLLVVKLRAHQLTPQAAWEAGDLEVPDLIYFLESLDRWGGFYWDKDPNLRRQMVALLVEHGQKQLEHPEALSPVVRLWLADYYESVKDARCIPLAESILDEVKQPVSGESPLVFQSVERIGWFYSSIGQYDKAAQTWMRMQKLYKDVGWSVSAAFQEAATQQLLSGEDEKALKTFEDLSNMGDGSFKTRSLVAQAIISLRSGDLVASRRYAQQAILLLDKEPDVDSKRYLSQSIAVLSLSKSFDDGLIILLPQKRSSSYVGKSKKSVVVAVIKVRSTDNIHINAQVDDPNFKVEVWEVRKGQISEVDVFTETQLIVTRKSDQLGVDSQTILTISGSTAVKQQIKVVIHADGTVDPVEQNQPKHL